MKLFTVINEQERAVIERLLEIQRKPLKERRGLIKALERDGYTVDFIGGRYQARAEGVLYRIPLKRCPSCRKRKQLGAFLTLRDVEHPWCQGCRHAHPVEAERARAERDYHVERGTYDVGMESRCQNPECPHGGVIPQSKMKYDPKFCSRECWESVTCGERRPCVGCGKPISKTILGDYCSVECRKKSTYKQCANPECTAMVPPYKKYHDMACKIDHHTKIGHFKAMSEKGNESQFITLKTTGQVPGYERRSRAVAESNSVNPRRKAKN